MANTVLTPTALTKESLMQTMNNLVLAKNVTRKYDDRFAVSGAKIGNSLDIRKENRFTVSTGQSLSLQDVLEESVTLTLDKQKHVDFQFSSNELSLSIDEFSDRYIKPATLELANQIDYDLSALYKDVYHSVGTPGTIMTDLSDALDAGRKLKEAGVPVGSKLASVIDAEAEASLINGLKGLFQSSSEIAKQYEKGQMGMAAGFKWYMDQNIQSHTVGAHGGTPLINGASQTGSSLITDGWTASTAVLKEGDVFNIAGVYSINPKSRQATKQLQDFVVTADGTSDGSGNLTVSISPSIVTSGARQTVSGSPADNAAITVKGTASTAYSQHLAFHEQAFALGCADLLLPKGVDMASRASDSQTGMSIRLVRAFDINNDRFPCRLDILYGVKTIKPEFACRIFN
ncbi:MAG: putative minor capsid protein 10B [Prokaryotic dsDNA virus sp.]|nr:MAG: putative minor capsid protein 10B [Prokaryotic dsDNA virus sp.]|tara:strand:- start:18801 stop:20006 length:1206 start_codon:yes stop_codon:yes gene_type:complete